MQLLSSLLPMIAAIAAELVGLRCLADAWQMKYRQRVDLITDHNGQPLPNPERHAGHFVAAYGRTGVFLVLSPLLLWFGLPLPVFGMLIAAAVFLLFYALDVASRRAMSD